MKPIKRLLLALMVTILLASCSVDDPIYETEHPEHGKITLVTDWSKIGEGIAKPSSYIIEMNGEKETATTDKHTIDYLFDAGTYRGYVYNQAEHITVTDGIATVTTSGGIVESMPGWFFSANIDVEIKKNTHHEVTATMQQQVRLLNIELTITDGDLDNIATVEASLSGVANAMNFKDNTYSGTGLKVEPVFTKNANKLIAAVRLMGLTGEVQNLTLNITYNNGGTQQIVSDVSSNLTDFNKDKLKPLTLKGDAKIFMTVDMQTTITKWEIQDTINGNAEVQ